MLRRVAGWVGGVHVWGTHTAPIGQNNETKMPLLTNRGGAPRPPPNPSNGGEGGRVALYTRGEL